jgi:hypothetical protein
MLTLKAWLGGMEGRRHEEDSAEQNLGIRPQVEFDMKASLVSRCRDK